MYNVTFEQFINYIAKILKISVQAGEAEPSAQVSKEKEGFVHSKYGPNL